MGTSWHSITKNNSCWYCALRLCGPFWKDLTPSLVLRAPGLKVNPWLQRAPLNKAQQPSPLAFQQKTKPQSLTVVVAQALLLLYFVSSIDLRSCDVSCQGLKRDALGHALTPKGQGTYGVLVGKGAMGWAGAMGGSAGGKRGRNGSVPA